MSQEGCHYIAVARAESFGAEGVGWPFGQTDRTQKGLAGGKKFDARARELAAGDTTLTVTAEALLAARAALAAQVSRLDKLLLSQARQDPRCQRLMTVPGVGAITATAFIATKGGGDPASHVGR